MAISCGPGHCPRRVGYGTAPVIPGLILGSLTEADLRRGMLLSGGDRTRFMLRPISAGLLALMILQRAA